VAGELAGSARLSICPGSLFCAGSHTAPGARLLAAPRATLVVDVVGAKIAPQPHRIVRTEADTHDRQVI